MKKSHKTFMACIVVMVVLGVALILIATLSFARGDGAPPTALLIILGGLTAGSAVLARSVRPDRSGSS